MPITRDEFKNLKQYDPEKTALQILQDNREHSTSEIAYELSTTVERACIILDGLGKKVPITKRLRSGVYWWRLKFSKGGKGTKSITTGSKKV